MGANCTSCKKPSSTNKNKYNTKNNLKNDKKNLGKSKSLTNSENKSNILNQLQNYNFFNNTKHKNDYYIECNLLFVNTGEIQKIAKYLEKWVQIISLSRTEKKISYQNLFSEKEKEKTLEIKSNNNDKNKNNSSNENNNTNINSNTKNLVSSKAKENNTHEINNKINYENRDIENNIISTTNNCEIKIYSGRDKFFSDLIIKLQIAFMYNKDRFIKFLSKGPPNNIRWAIWLTIALTDPTSKFLTESEYAFLTSKSDLYYQQNFDDQIKKDIKRSNLGLEYLTEKLAEECLYRVLKALALSDPELGYCQGMNIITANLLMLSDCNEMETFNLMFYLLKNLELREFFLNGFPKLLMFIFLFREFIKDQYPNIHKKLEFLDIPEELWVFKWLQTLFFLTLPLAISVRILDCVLCFGLEFLLNFSLSYVKENEKKIIQCNSMESFIELFKGPEIDDEEESTEDNKTNDYYLNEKNIVNANGDVGNINSTEVNMIEKFNYDKEDNYMENFNGENENNKKININLKKDEEKNNDNNLKQNINSLNRKLSYFKGFDFSKDIISYRESLIREAKRLCIRDLIDKMIDTYSQNNYNPLFNYKSNHVLNNLNNQEPGRNLNTSNISYDYQKTVNFDEDHFENKPPSERAISSVSSSRSVNSLSYSSKSIMEELSEYVEDDDSEKNVIKEEKDFEISNNISEESPGINNNIDLYSNNELDRNNINDEIQCKVNKRTNIRLTQENIAKDFGPKKSKIFNSKSIYAINKNLDLDANHNNKIGNLNINNIKPKHFSNLGLVNRKSKLTNFCNCKSKDILVGYGERCKSVRFDISTSTEFLNQQLQKNQLHRTIKPQNLTETESNNTNSISSKLNPDIFEFSVPKKAFNSTTYNNNNFYKKSEDNNNASLYTNEKLANTYNNNNVDAGAQKAFGLNKVSATGITIYNNDNNNRLPKRFCGNKNNVRQSLSLNFGRRLNLEQIMMMNKIKSKMSIIQSVNKNESKRKIEKSSSGLNLNLSSGVCKKEKIKSDNNEINYINYFLSEKKIEDKNTASNYVLSTCERKNTLNSGIYDNLNSHQAIKLGLSGFADDNEFGFKIEPPCDSEKLKNFDLREKGNKFYNKVCEREWNSPYKKQFTLLTFNYKKPFESTAGRENNFNNSNENNRNNLISSSNFKLQRDLETMNNLNGVNKNSINNKDKTKSTNVYSKGKNESKVYFKNNNKNEVYKNNLNDIIIEEEHGLGNIDD
jgi:hypothetical protein